MTTISAIVINLLRRSRLPLILGILVLLVSGCQSPRQPFLIGIYGVNKTNLYPQLRKAGFDIVTGSPNRETLNAAHRAGLKVFSNIGTTPGFEFNAATAKSAVRQADAHPALWAWYLIDEPDLNNVHPEQVRSAYRYLKSLGTRKPLGVVLQSGAQSGSFSQGADILLIDRYPIAWQPLSVFEQHVQLTRLGAGPDKPVFGIVQAFDWTYFKEMLPGETAFRPPTENEISCMTYGALAQQANGVFYFTFSSGDWDIQQHPETWNALQRVVSEINQRRGLFEAEHLWWPWKNSLLFQDTRRLNEVLDSRVTLAWLHVHKSSPDVPPGEYVLAVNNSGEPANVRIFLPRATTGPVQVLGGGERPVNENWVREKLEAYGVRIYGPLPVE